MRRSWLEARHRRAEARERCNEVVAELNQALIVAAKPNAEALLNDVRRASEANPRDESLAIMVVGLYREVSDVNTIDITREEADSFRRALGVVPERNTEPWRAE
jgi:hypothetical protein